MSHTYKTDLQFPSAHQYQMDGTMGEVCSYSWRWNKKDKTITIEAMIYGYKTDRWYGMGVMPADEEEEEVL